ncbi:MAG TPA: glycosyltransferase family 39 protein [Candidatus Nitrosotalea sp.]|nr:glycosyltransferase family 39 protein [Candidatus Nitrosotalea sp.]
MSGALSALHGRAGRRWFTWQFQALTMVLYALVRLPSFFEPYWYTDEAGYSVTARQALGGSALYSQAWTNKPPLQIWSVAAAQRVFGPSEWGLHVLTFFSGLIALLAVIALSRSILGGWRALLASAGYALLLGLPALNAEIAVPESLLVAPVTCAGALILWRLCQGGPPSGRWGALWAPASGILLGLGLGFQQTVLADEAALFWVLMVVPGRTYRELGLHLAGLALAVAAWLGPALAVAGGSEVWFSLVGFYRSYAQYSAPRSGVITGLLIVCPPLAAAGAVLLRRSANPMWAAFLWASATLWVVALANRPYPHFWIPVAAPLVLGGASLPPRLAGWGRRALPLGAAFAVLGVLASPTPFEDVATQAYLLWPRALLTSSQSVWQLRFNSTNAPADQAVSRFILEQEPAGASTVLWSSSAWPYLLANLQVQMRAAPIYNDVVLMGSGADVAAQVRELAPDLIVTSTEGLQQWPQIDGLLHRRYEVVYSSGVDTVYQRLPAPPAPA